MEEQNNLEKHSQKLLNNIGCLGMMGLIFIGLAAISAIWPIIRLCFCAVLGVKCIDEESGEYVSIPWLGVGEFLTIGIILIRINKIYDRFQARR